MTGKEPPQTTFYVIAIFLLLLLGKAAAAVCLLHVIVNKLSPMLGTEVEIINSGGEKRWRCRRSTGFLPLSLLSSLQAPTIPCNILFNAPRERRINWLPGRMIKYVFTKHTRRSKRETDHQNSHRREAWILIGQEECEFLKLNSTRTLGDSLAHVLDLSAVEEGGGLTSWR